VTTSDTDLMAWASEWADKYDQGWDEPSLEKLTGQTVSVTHPDKRHGYEIKVVGYGAITIQVGESPVKQYCLVSDEGRMYPIMAGVEIEVVAKEGDSG